MITEFTCGIYTAELYGDEWGVHANGSAIAIISIDGADVKFLFVNLYVSCDTLIEIAVLMNNIKRQYKQLQTN